VLFNALRSANNFQKSSYAFCRVIGYDSALFLKYISLFENKRKNLFRKSRLKQKICRCQNYGGDTPSFRSPNFYWYYKTNAKNNQ